MTDAGVDIPQALVDALRKADHVAVLTGAGVSAESGLPTFRDKMTGLWAKYDPMELATPEAFERDPDLVTRWYDFRVGEGGKHAPNPGHFARAELERSVTDRGRGFTLLTQNVDGFHRDAGSISVAELHGTIRTWRCVTCEHPIEHSAGGFETYPPRCVACDEGTLRPNVVWFGEMLPREALEIAEHAISVCDVFISAGTSGVVYPAAGFIEAAGARGATTAEINLEPTPLTPRVDHALHGKSGLILPALVSRVTSA